jgi:hypothetical protein
VFLECSGWETKEKMKKYWEKRTGPILRIRQWGGGGDNLQKGAILYWVWRDDRLLLVKKVVWKSMVFFCSFPPLGLHFVRFLRQIFGYTVLHYTVDRLNLQLSACMVCLCKYHNSVTNLFSLAFQQLKSIGSGVCFPLGNFWNLRYLQHNV